MTNTGGSSTPAGWYNDPGGSGHLRWWDGTAWSAHLAPQPTPTPVVPPPVAPVPPAYEPTATTVENEPYVPFQGSWNQRQQNVYGQSADVDFARPARWNTAGAWLLAFSYPMSLVVAAAYVAVNFATFATESTQARQDSITFASVWIQVALWVLMVLFALMDRSKLISYGYVRPSRVWWILLLPPLVYLIMRGVGISREVRHGFGPLIAYLATAVGIVLLSVITAIAIPALLAGSGVIGSSESSASFASSLQRGLNENGAHYVVTCPPRIPDTVGASFSCNAVASGSGEVLTLDIEVVRGANGQPTAKLLSMTPAITN